MSSKKKVDLNDTIILKDKDQESIKKAITKEDITKEEKKSTSTSKKLKSDVIIMIVVAVMILLVFLMNLILSTKESKDNNYYKKLVYNNKTSEVTETTTEQIYTTNVINQDFVKNQILLSFKDSATDEEIKAVLDSIDKKEYTESYGTYVITFNQDFNSLSDLRSYCSNLKSNNSIISICEQNGIYQIPDCSTGPC